MLVYVVQDSSVRRLTWFTIHKTPQSGDGRLADLSWHAQQQQQQQQ